MDPAPSTASQAVAAESISGDALAAELLGPATVAAAPVSVPDTVSIKNETGPTLKTEQRDSLNRLFDAKIFRTKSKTDPAPFLNARGEYMPRGGRKAGSVQRPGRATGPAIEIAPRASFVPPIPQAPKPAETAGPGSPGPVPPAPAAPAVNRSAMERTAERYLRIFYLAADKAVEGRGEWQPDDAGEHADLKAPLAEHLIEKNAKPLTPLVELLIAGFVYVLKRITRPNTARAVSSWWGGKVSAAKPVAPAAPAATAQPQAPRSELEIEPLRQ